MLYKERKDGDEDKGVLKGNQFTQTLPCPFKAGGIMIMGRSEKRAGTLSSLSCDYGASEGRQSCHRSRQNTAQQQLPVKEATSPSSFLFLLFIFLPLLLSLLSSQSLAIHAAMALPASLVTGENWQVICLLAPQFFRGHQSWEGTAG